MIKRLSFLCICLMLLSILATSYHHHDDGADHPECSICLACHQQSDSSYGISRHEVVRPLIPIVYAAPVLAVVTDSSLTPGNGRAPPC